jgi:hypothetical protein
VAGNESGGVKLPLLFARAVETIRKRAEKLYYNCIKKSRRKCIAKYTKIDFPI